MGRIVVNVEVLTLGSAVSSGRPLLKLQISIVDYIFSHKLWAAIDGIDYLPRYRT